MIKNSIQRAFKKKKEKGYECLYFAIDVHDTIYKANYSNKEHQRIWFDMSKETLQLMSKMKDIKLILYTCTHQKYIQLMLDFFNENNIQFDYVNENPGELSNDLSDFSKKFYFDVLLDDKAGFNGETDWHVVYTEIFNYCKETNKIINF